MSMSEMSMSETSNVPKDVFKNPEMCWGAFCVPRGVSTFVAVFFFYLFFLMLFVFFAMCVVFICFVMFCFLFYVIRCCMLCAVLCDVLC